MVISDLRHTEYSNLTEDERNTWPHDVQNIYICIYILHIYLYYIYIYIYYTYKHIHINNKHGSNTYLDIYIQI